MDDGKDNKEEDNSFDMNDILSESMPSKASVEGGSNDVEEVSQDGIALGSQSPKANRAVKRLKEGVSVSPTKRAKRGQRAACWKYFKQITVASNKEKGVMLTKAKCKFCHFS